VRVLCVVSCSLVALVAVGCGSGDGTKSRRAAVNHYLDGVQHAQIELVGRQGQIDGTLQSFSLTNAKPGELRDLRLARTTIATALHRVRALDAPPDAKQLEALLARRLALQQALVDELIQTLHDEQRLAAASPSLAAAAARLRTDLAAVATTPRLASTVPRSRSKGVLDRYGQAFGRYGDALRPIVPALAPAHNGSLLRPTLEAEQKALGASVALCGAIRRYLAPVRPDIPKANAAIHSLLTLAASLNGAQVRKDEAAAARAYDGRIAKLNTLAQAIGAERNRLVRTLG